LPWHVLATALVIQASSEVLISTSFVVAA
jgi:hypothetical protein